MSTPCPACNGKLKASRRTAIEQVIEHHRESCPGRGITRKKEQHDDDNLGADQRTDQPNPSA